MAARYESDLRIRSVQAQRRMHTLGVLAGIAALVLGYDVLAVILAR